MMHVPRCDERTLDGLVRSIRKIALDRPISFHFEAGMHRDADGHESVNGTYTFTLNVCGGANDTGVTSAPVPRAHAGLLPAVRAAWQRLRGVL